MIDYGRLKAANNVTLSNPVLEGGSIVSIDVTYNEYDRFSGEILRVKTVKVRRTDIISHRNNLNDKFDELEAEKLVLKQKSDDMAEFIADAKLAAGI